MEWTDHLSNIRHSSSKGHYSKPYGKDNPNYGNTKLKEFFAEHPEERKKLGRPGAQNGKAQKIRLRTATASYEFGHIGECAKYLLENKIVRNVTHKSLCGIISLKSKTGDPYQTLHFERI